MSTAAASAGAAAPAPGLLQLIALLRAAGLKVGTDAALEAARCLPHLDLARREEVRAGLRAVLVHEHADGELFDRAFDALYAPRSHADPDPLPALPPAGDAPAAPGTRRLTEALAQLRALRPAAHREQLLRDASGTASELERLGRKDFEQMTASELEAARRLLRAAPPPQTLESTRRFVRAAAGRELDLRATLRASARRGELVAPVRRAAALRPTDWVLLVDVSGSMTVYARMFLQLAHALGRGARRVETFAFATRLTRLTPLLRTADADAALQAAARAVADWDSGTRIGECLERFNREWSRRALARGGWAILLTDGLERGDPALLEREVRRLARTCRELVWLNPLRRSARYAPLAAGARILDRYATRQRSAHDLDSLLGLARALV